MKIHKICAVCFLLFLLSGCAMIGLLSDMADDSSGEPLSSESAGGDQSRSVGTSKPVKSESEEQAAGSAQSGSEQVQRTEPQKAPESEETPKPEEPLYSGVLHVSNEEIVSSVQVYHVADDGFNRPGLAEYDVVDLNDFGAWHEFVDTYDNSPRIVFMADAPVTDFRYLEIETVFDENMGIVIVDTLYQLDALTSEKPFVVNWISIGDVGMFRGVSFTEEDGTNRYFGFNISGYDGDVYFIEFKPE